MSRSPRELSSSCLSRHRDVVVRRPVIPVVLHAGSSILRRLSRVRFCRAALSANLGAGVRRKRYEEKQASKAREPREQKKRTKRPRVRGLAASDVQNQTEEHRGKP